MGLPGSRGRAWLLGAAALLLPGGCCGSRSTKHMYSVLWTGVSESGQGLSWFSTVVYLDDLLLGVYNSDGKRIVPRVPWVEKWEKEDPQRWQKETRTVRIWLFEFQWILEKLLDVYNHSQGLHTLQLRTSCELKAGGQRGGLFQVAYDQRDIMAFDKETLSWTAVDAAKNIPEMWAAFGVPHVKAYLEVGCFMWLQKHLVYGKKTLQRREPPVLKVTRKASYEGLETLLCQAHGFYPKEIDVTWRKDGEVRQENTFRGVVGPNPDGTYYTWLSIAISPRERIHYRCHVEHDGLLEPLGIAVEEPASVPQGLLVGLVLLGVIPASLLTGILLYGRVLGKGPFSSLLLRGPPPTQPSFLGADLSCPPASFCGENRGAKLEPADPELTDCMMS